MIDTMEFLFTVCIVLGLAVPLLDVVLGIFGSLLNVDFDIGGHHLGDIFQISGDASADTGNVLPFNFMCLCFSLVVFGAIGRLTTGLMVSTWAFIGCLAGLLVISAAAYYLVFKFIVKPLKKSNPKALGHWDLFGTKGKLTLRITGDSAGTVSLRDSTGAVISYEARAKRDVLEMWNGLIPQGTEVIVVDIENSSKFVYVRPTATLKNVNFKP